MGVGVLGGVDQGEQGLAPEGAGGDSSGALPAVSVRALRGPAVRRLLALRREGNLTTGQVRSAADVLGVRERAVWRWLAAAEQAQVQAALVLWRAALAAGLPAGALAGAGRSPMRQSTSRCGWS